MPIYSGLSESIKGARMLTLSRKRDESITILTSQGRVTISISAISGQQARIGVDAPQDIRITRMELMNSEPLHLKAKQT